MSHTSIDETCLVLQARLAVLSTVDGANCFGVCVSCFSRRDTYEHGVYSRPGKAYPCPWTWSFSCNFNCSVTSGQGGTFMKCNLRSIEVPHATNAPPFSATWSLPSPPPLHRHRSSRCWTQCKPSRSRREQSETSSRYSVANNSAIGVHTYKGPVQFSGHLRGSSAEGLSLILRHLFTFRISCFDLPRCCLPCCAFSCHQPQSVAEVSTPSFLGYQEECKHPLSLLESDANWQ